MFYRIINQVLHLQIIPYNMLKNNRRFIHVSKRRFNENLVQYFKLSKSEAQHMCLKYPALSKVTKDRLTEVVETVKEIGFNKKVLVDEPSLICLLPATMKFRHEVLKECGVLNISPEYLVSYLKIMKSMTIAQLRGKGILHPTLNIENKLASYMTQWPTSLTTLIYGDSENNTLYKLRLKIIQRYLELMLDLSEDEFIRAIRTYSTIKHRPLASINETLLLLQSKIMLSNDKIKSNMYLIHADPNNLKQIVYKLRTLAGIDVTEVIRVCPRIAVRNISYLAETKKILEDFNISHEAQMRCFTIFTLGVDTVRERLKQIHSIPEFEPLFQHPRFLKIVIHKNKVMERLRKLYENNKKCSSINILSGSTESYKSYEKSHGDRSGKGKDVMFYLCHTLNGPKGVIKNMIRRHPFWINVPIAQIKHVHIKLLDKFSEKDILENCVLLLYPWKKINFMLNRIYKDKSSGQQCHQVDLRQLNKSQLLSLTLYLLEEKHYFSGNGVWTEDKIKDVVDLLPNKTAIKD